MYYLKVKLWVSQGYRYQEICVLNMENDINASFVFFLVMSLHTWWIIYFIFDCEKNKCLIEPIELCTYIPNSWHTYVVCCWFTVIEKVTLYKVFYSCNRCSVRQVLSRYGVTFLSFLQLWWLSVRAHFFHINTHSHES